MFPDTYQFYSGGDAKTVINKMLRNFDNKMTDELRQTISDSGYTMDEIITIASLIEKETDGSDGTKISSVIRNRLKNSGETAGYHADRCGTALRAGRAQRGADRCRQGDR